MEINQVYRNAIIQSGIVDDVSDMVGTIIEGASFAREVPTHVFPPTMRGVTFSYCNLDNVFIPEGNILISCRNNFYKVQEDGQDWIVDPDTMQPIKLLNE